MPDAHLTQWTFFARVLPERIPLKFADPMTGTSSFAELGIAYDYDIGIADSQVVADVAITRGDPDIHTLRNLVEADIRDLTDIVGYLHGLTFDVEMISAVSQTRGERIVFGIAIPVLVARRNQKGLGQLKSELRAAILSDNGARIALANFREAMRGPLGTGFFCYRAVEAMMQTMKSSDTEKEKHAWFRLRAALQIDESATRFLQGHADIPRHGKPNSISDEDRARVFEITDEIIRRYLHFVMRKRVTLPIAEFPMLTA